MDTGHQTGMYLGYRLQELKSMACDAWRKPDALAAIVAEIQRREAKQATVMVDTP